MKQLLLLTLTLMVIYSCQKDYQSPEEQLVAAIENKANMGDRPLDALVLKTDKLCGKIDCTVDVIEHGNTTLTIYSREDIFMRAPSIYFRLAQWTDAPSVVAIGRRGELLTDEQVEHKCRGN
ncbi:MAG: hypothetical protein HKN68_04155 [Saprospiraceae bacterium]|nr:hypothetical protein [Saprospiraceae bacterium]